MRASTAIGWQCGRSPVGGTDQSAPAAATVVVVLHRGELSVLASRPDRELLDGFRPIQALIPGFGVPVVLTRVGLEAPPIAKGVSAFVATAQNHGVNLEILDVPHGHHAFDLVDPRPESTGAVNRALALVRVAISR